MFWRVGFFIDSAYYVRDFWYYSDAYAYYHKRMEDTSSRNPQLYKVRDNSKFKG